MPDRKRAAQFMPFNGLRGYAEQVTAAQIRRAARREITEDRARALNDALLGLARAVELEPDNIIALQKIADDLLERNESIQAAEHYGLILGQDPKNARALR